MTSQAKMIIITTDEHIIRQFTYNKNENTHIIPMDDNTMNLNFLTESTSNNEQNSKRAVDTTEHNQSKPVKTRKKSLDLICIICGDHATGYNYGIISCASCKAFFHRNGNEDLKRFKCIMNNNQCLIDHKISRKCYRCRLKRCLSMGMRKDLLLSQDEIQRRKDVGRNRKISFNVESIETNHLLINKTQIDHENIPVCENNELKLLSIEDLAVIQSIQSSFLSVFDNECPEFDNHVIQPNDPYSELTCCLQYNSDVALRLIRFFRSIAHFENLDADDRFILIKYNLLSLFGIMSCYRRKLSNGSSYTEEEEEKLKRQLYMLCGQSDHMYQMVVNLSACLMEVVQHDDVLLSLLLTTFLFSKGLSMDENEPSLKHSLPVYQAQSYYMKLLWNYLITKQGENNISQYFTRIITAIFRAQSGVVRFKEFMHTKMMPFDSVEEIAPLMQTILHIS